MYDIRIVDQYDILYADGMEFVSNIYQNLYGFRGESNPQALVVVRKKSDTGILATLGLDCDHTNLFLFEHSEPPDPFKTLVQSVHPLGDIKASREQLAEITRFAIAKDEITARETLPLSISMLKYLLQYGWEHKKRYYGFVGKESFKRILTSLNIPMYMLGKPHFDDTPYKDTIGPYLEQRPFCIGFYIEHPIETR